MDEEKTSTIAADSMRDFVGLRDEYRELAKLKAASRKIAVRVMNRRHSKLREVHKC